MSVTIEIDLSGLEQMANKFRDISGIQQAMLNGMRNALVKVANKIADDKLEGQVLDHRSGRLSSSVRHPPEPEVVGGTVQGKLTSVFYGAVQEYGATINGPVYIEGVGWRYIGELEPRPWMEPGVKENEDTFQEEISASVMEKLRE